MLAQHFYLIRTAVIALLLLFLPVIHSADARQLLELEPESEPSLESLSQSTQTAPLPLGTLLDSEGKPINLPDQEQSSFEYSAPTLTPAEPSKATKSTKDTQSTKATKSKKLSRKQQLASREHVANDPNCRWLDKRMDQLEAQLGGKQDNAATHQADELSARQKEWQCLKCGAEGPAQNDHSNCQYRR
ncbi:hypothetical protein [Shewanella baltica]|uniref:Uncharacterized protein n=1 Tax=Shewanella baltica (strain OS155 / ATCC BAA-1091) TaxID=325240 RepID=A3CYU4_SHEB5|nr:hypothetical protein [Shewanella baltica]ABN59657.1 conserved hypothetical protein [Shewanella baltica OS155]AEH11925.1 hypothetical protein Sbal117_0122 [Shewanella baltica OS117]